MLMQLPFPVNGKFIHLWKHRSVERSPDRGEDFNWYDQWTITYGSGRADDRVSVAFPFSQIWRQLISDRRTFFEPFGRLAMSINFSSLNIRMRLATRGWVAGHQNMQFVRGIWIWRLAWRRKPEDMEHNHIWIGEKHLGRREVEVDIDISRSVSISSPKALITN
jgi:hypothetical protein